MPREDFGVFVKYPVHAHAVERIHLWSELQVMMMCVTASARQTVDEGGFSSPWVGR